MRPGPNSGRTITIVAQADWPVYRQNRTEPEKLSGSPTDKPIHHASHVRRLRTILGTDEVIVGDLMLCEVRKAWRPNGPRAMLRRYFVAFKSYHNSTDIEFSNTGLPLAVVCLCLFHFLHLLMPVITQQLPSLRRKGYGKKALISISKPARRAVLVLEAMTELSH